MVIGGGSAGLAISHQLLRSGKFTQDDIAVVDPAYGITTNLGGLSWAQASRTEKTCGNP
jgi:glycine/D-amino acid oxidase-like deaminating enzyme